MHAVVPVILSGGSGTRLWPLSSEDRPKQFLPLYDNKTLLQNTVLRTTGIPAVTPPLVVCNENHAALVLEQLQAIETPPQALILEPQGRNTAPAIALAALHLQEQGQDPVMLVMPSDHVIADINSFKAGLIKAIDVALKGQVALLGVKPAHADTGFGYIVSNQDDGKVCRFVEKPQKEIAEQLLSSGDCFWNSGIFVLKASVCINELQTHAPAVLAACRKAMEMQTHDGVFVKPQAQAFLSSPSVSIDHAVMEKTDQAMVVPVACGWSDVGSWQRLWHIGKKDTDGNVQSGNVVCDKASNSYLHSTKRRIVAVGIENLVVIETADTILIANKNSEHDILKLSGISATDSD